MISDKDLVVEGSAQGALDNTRAGPAMGVATRIDGTVGSKPSPPKVGAKATRLGSRKLMAGLQAAGLSRRRSRRALHAVLKAWTDALRRYEPVEVGPGWWLVVAGVRQRRRWRLNRIVDIPRHFLTVKLELPKRYRRRSSPPR